MLYLATIVLALSSSALGGLFITHPTASETLTGGQKYTVTWIDSPDSAPGIPTPAQMGLTNIGIWTGTPQQQVPVQTFPPLDVSKVSTLDITPDPKAAGNGNGFFIRFDSVGFKVVTNGTEAPGQSFSARFTLAGMTGTTPAVGSASSSLPVVPVTSTSSSAASKPATSSTAAKTGSTAASSSTAKPSGAASSLNAPVIAYAGVLAGLFGALL